MTDHWCGHCRKECDAHVVDEGIGHYEFWGAKGVDVQLTLISDCCDEPMYDDEECTIECSETADEHMSDIADDEADAKYQQRKDDGDWQAQKIICDWTIDFYRGISYNIYSLRGKAIPLFTANIGKQEQEV